MPQKTRKEKILAAHRKQYRIIEPPVTYSDTKVFTKSGTAAKTLSVSPQLLTEENQIRKHFIIDLKKSLLIIGFVFALEFFFYFATMSNILSKYLNF